MADQSAHPIVFVEWIDASSCNAWVPVSDKPDENIRVVTIGFLVHDLPDRVVVTTSLCSAGNAMDPLTITRAQIQKMWYVEFVK